MPTSKASHQHTVTEQSFALDHRIHAYERSELPRTVTKQQSSLVIKIVCMLSSLTTNTVAEQSQLLCFVFGPPRTGFNEEK